MNILILYATNSSGTQTVSKVIENVLIASQHAVTRKDIRELQNLDDLNQFDLIALGSPSWDYKGAEGQPHEFMRTFIENMQGRTLPDKKFAIFGLGDTAYMNFCGAVDHLEKFVSDTQGKLVVPSLRIDGFYFNQSANEKVASDWANALVTHLQTT